MQKRAETYKVYKPEFELHSTLLKDFLLNFQDYSMDNDIIHGRKKYMVALQKIANKQTRILEIHLDDIETFCEKDVSLYKEVVKTTKRYIKILQDVVDTIIPKRSIELKDDVNYC